MFAIYDYVEDVLLGGTYETVEEANNTLMGLVDLHNAEADTWTEESPEPLFALGVTEV